MEEKDKESCYHETSFLDKNGNLKTLKIPVVQELARRGRLTHLPDGFKRPHSNHAHKVFDEMPTIISLAKLKRDGSEPMVRAEELAKLAEAAKGSGLFLILDHGVPLEVVEGAKGVVKGFFELSFEEKKGCVGTYSDIDNMGYGRNFVKSEDHVLDWIDRLTVRAAPPVDEGLHVWPLKPSNFRYTPTFYSY